MIYQTGPSFFYQKAAGGGGRLNHYQLFGTCGIYSPIVNQITIVPYKYHYGSEPYHYGTHGS